MHRATAAMRQPVLIALVAAAVGAAILTCFLLAIGAVADDLIVAGAGTRIRGPSALIAAIAARKPGDKLTLRVQRGARILSITPTLARQPTAPAPR